MKSATVIALTLAGMTTCVKSTSLLPQKTHSSSIDGCGVPNGLHTSATTDSPDEELSYVSTLSLSELGRRSSRISISKLERRESKTSVGNVKSLELELRALLEKDAYEKHKCDVLTLISAPLPQAEVTSAKCFPRPHLKQKSCLR